MPIRNWDTSFVKLECGHSQAASHNRGKLPSKVKCGSCKIKKRVLGLGTRTRM